jgi:hypothetical protein
MTVITVDEWYGFVPQAPAQNVVIGQVRVISDCLCIYRSSMLLGPVLDELLQVLPED